MNNNTVLMFSTVLLICTGCYSVEETEKRAVCNDFSTPWSNYVSIFDGVVSWKVSENSNLNKYMMMGGDICYIERRKTN